MQCYPYHHWSILLSLSIFLLLPSNHSFLHPISAVTKTLSNINLRANRDAIYNKDTSNELLDRQFFASTVSGLEDVLYKEIINIPGINKEKVIKSKCGVKFQGDDTIGYYSLIWLRSSLKLMELIHESKGINTKDDLYKFSSTIDWEMYLDSTDTLKCDTVLGITSPELSHSHFSSLTIKNAIVDQFRGKFSSRPSVDLEDPFVSLSVYLHKDKASLYRVWSGENSMHKRGYRDSIIHKSALRETTAASLVICSHWDSNSEILCDPMCGSGTIAVEAALIAANCAPGLIRYEENTVFNTLPKPLQWKDVNKMSWKRQIEEAKKLDTRKSFHNKIIYANDHHSGAIRLAKLAAMNAGVENMIEFDNQEISHYKPSSPINMIITNPPWDIRLNENARDSWEDLKEFGKQIPIKKLFALSGNEELLKILGESHGEKNFHAASVQLSLGRF